MASSEDEQAQTKAILPFLQVCAMSNTPLLLLIDVCVAVLLM